MSELLDSDLLRTFLAIVDHGSFAAAADRVHRTQSAVSMQMRKLEELIGQPLFERQGRIMRLTGAGERLVGHARRIIQAHRDALATFSATNLEGHVVLGAPDDYTSGHLPRILASFAESYPRVQVDIFCERSIKLVDHVAEGSVDIALVSNMFDRPGVIPLHREPVVWVGSNRHCTEERRPLPLALFHPGCALRQWALDALGEAGIPYRIASTCMSLTGIRAVVDAGLAVAVLPCAAIPESFRVLGADEGFPPLPMEQIGLLRQRERVCAIQDRLETHIVDWFRQQRSLAAAA